MRAFFIAAFLLIAPAASAQTAPTLEQINSTMTSIEDTMLPLKVPYTMLVTKDVSKEEVFAYVQSIMTARHVAGRASGTLTAIRNAKVLKKVGGRYDLQDVNRLERFAQKLGNEANGRAGETAQYIKSELASVERGIEHLIEPNEKVLGLLTDDGSFKNMLGDIEKARAAYRRAGWMQEGFGADSSGMLARIAAIDGFEENLRGQREAQLAGSGLPEAASTDPDMMAAAEGALKNWGKGDEYGPIVLTSKAIKAGSRAEAGLKSGGGTNAVIETSVFRWQGFVFWVPVREGDDWFLHRMVARKYSQGNGVPIDSWRVWNEGKMRRILPSTWE